MFWFMPVQPWTYLAFALVIVLSFAMLLLWEARFRSDAWYRRFDRGSPWQRRSWGF